MTAIAALLAWPALWTAVDDAFISARYAEHLASGHGWTWNAHGPAIEGFSNPLWTGWIAVGLFLGVPAHGWMVGWGLLGWLTAIPASWGLARSLGASESAALLAPLTLACSPLLAVASSNGLETGWSLALLVWVLWGALEAEGRTGSALVGVGAGLLAWLRPEGALLGPAILALRLATRRPPRIAAMSWLGVVLALFAWRLASFGTLLPNTVGAKLGGRDGIDLLTQNLRYMSRMAPTWLGYGIAALASAWVGRRRPEVLLALATGLVLVLPALSVELWMPGQRLLLPLMVVVGAVAPAALGHSRAGIGFLLLLALGQLLPRPQRIARIDDAAHSVLPDNGTAVAGRWLREHAPEGATMAVRDAGCLAFYAGPGVEVHELHERALTRPHPGGADLEPDAPPNPTIVVLTQARREADDIRYPQDRRVFEALTEPYTPLGRVHQHHHRYYDLHVRADAGIPPLPPGIVVGPAAPR